MYMPALSPWQHSHTAIQVTAHLKRLIWDLFCKCSTRKQLRLIEIRNRFGSPGTEED